MQQVGYRVAGAIGYVLYAGEDFHEPGPWHGPVNQNVVGGETAQGSKHALPAGPESFARFRVGSCPYLKRVVGAAHLLDCCDLLLDGFG